MLHAKKLRVHSLDIDIFVRGDDMVVTDVSNLGGRSDVESSFSGERENQISNHGTSKKREIVS